MISSIDPQEIRAIVRRYTRPETKSPEQILASIWNHRAYIKRRKRFYDQGLTASGTPRKRLPGVYSTYPHAEYMREWRRKKRLQEAQ